MKFITTALSALILFIMGTGVKAQEMPFTTGTGTAHYAVTMAVALSTESVTSSAAGIHTVSMNNASILKALAMSGSAGSLTAPDMDIVMNTSSLQVDVINKATNALIWTIGRTGTQYSLISGTIIEAAAKATVTVAATGYTVTLPNVSPLNTNILSHVTELIPGGRVTGISSSYVGGNGISNGSNFIQGSFRKAKKVYYY